jgi:8-oxo-dGTP pyrophosphatase MutT (NUDIX family)
MDLCRLPESLESVLLPLDPAGESATAAGRLREAAVLLLLFPRDGDVRFLLTLRPASLSHHAEQISLPGGAVEPRDAGHWEAALRETREELGIETGALVPLGRLATHHINVSAYSVTPFVGWAAESPRLNPDPREVAEVIEARLEDLLAPQSVAEETWTYRDAPWRIAFFRLNGHAVWGATARILADFVERVRADASWPGPVPGAAVPL